MKKQLQTGIILCGGQSSRMGMDKGLVPYCGKPLILNAIAILEEVCAEILISTNNPSYHSFGHKTVPDKLKSIGPMGGISACLEESKSEINLVLSCDMPFIRPALYDFLLRNLENNLVSVPYHGEGKYEPVCGVYKSGVLPRMLEHIQHVNHKLPDFFTTIPISAVRIGQGQDFYHPHLFFNINTPRQLKEAEFIFESGGAKM